MKHTSVYILIIVYRIAKGTSATITKIHLRLHVVYWKQQAWMHTTTNLYLHSTYHRLCDHITPALIDLHWLPVTLRLQFKLLLLVYKSLHNQSPPYIEDLLSLKPATNYALRSSTQSLLFVPKANCSSPGDRAFAHAAPVLWNSLPLTIRTSSSLAIFKKQLKTFSFRKAFSLFQ